LDGRVANRDAAICNTVIPAKAGIHVDLRASAKLDPAFAGMTKRVVRSK
jgi:hypothetical protein